MTFLEITKKLHLLKYIYHTTFITKVTTKKHEKSTFMVSITFYTIGS